MASLEGARFDHMDELMTIERLLADPIANYPAATVACFDPTTGNLPRRALDEGRTVAFLERLAAAGAPALLIAASTGHGHLRTQEELQQWFEIAASANRGNVILTALLRPEDGADANQRFARLLAELGYAVAFVRPGSDLSPQATTDEVIANMQPVVQALAEAGLAVGLYSIPDVSGLPMTPDVAAALIAGPGGNQIVAIKVTEANYDGSTARFLSDARLSHLKIVQGWDPHLARALREGKSHDTRGRQRCGITSGPMSFAIHQYLHILDSAERGDWDEVAAAQSAVTRLFEAMQDDPTKFADLQRAKFIMGLGQPLTGTVAPKQFDRVLTALNDLPRPADRDRLARSLNLMEDGPFQYGLRSFYTTSET
jgi:dihydrodipicolinate synthase/N-acetylneuraminate lyase